MTIELIEVKVSELSGEALNWAVALATGAGELKVTDSGSVCCIYEMPCGGGCWTNYYQPSTDWSQAGPLITKYHVSLIYAFEQYDALIGMTISEQDESPLIAACRAIVASVLGDTVSVPQELCHE